MAFFDDSRFLLSHIRHSFITCDDTGMCEMAMLNEIIHHERGDEDEDEDEEVEVEMRSELDGGQSYDILSDMEMMGAHRRRSNTAQRLDRLKKERKNMGKVKMIQWKLPPIECSTQELDDIFPVKKVNEERKKKSSLLSLELEKFPSLPDNPFNEFARFDGRLAEVRGTTKKILIFFPFSSSPLIPLEVVSLSCARVQDLIGLICWLYTNEGREPGLRSDVNGYSLRIAEENGEVDTDFPSLNPKEPVGKFGFPVLALLPDHLSLTVTVYIDEMFSKIQVPKGETNLKWILDQTMKKRKTTFKDFTCPEDPSSSSSSSSCPLPLVHHLEKAKEPGIKLDPLLKLSDVDTREFRIVISSSSSPGPGGRGIKGMGSPPFLQESSIDMSAIEAPLYKSYLVSTIHKLGRNADIQLGISGKKVDINPIPGKSSSKLFSWTPKAASYDVEKIAECELLHGGGKGGNSFKIVCHTGTQFESFRFHSQSGPEIVKKLKYIMEMRSSPIREEYWASKREERKWKPAGHQGIYGKHIPGF